MKTANEYILRRYYEATVRYPYSIDQKTRILRLLCQCEGIDSHAMEQTVARIHREFDIAEVGDADCYLLVIPEDDPSYLGLRALRDVLRKCSQEHLDPARWRQEIMTARNQNLKAIALLAYAEGRVSCAIDFWEKHLTQAHDWEVMSMCAVAYAELENYERALYHSACALYWAREVLMLEHSHAEGLFELTARAVGERAPEICRSARQDIERRSRSATPCRIGFN